jgi:antitoxin component YwqK of YwqJK toxin-antitoxin module
MRPHLFSLVLGSLVLSFSSVSAQSITLNDLMSLCSKQNWEEVDRILTTKGWRYYESTKGNTVRYNTITWSYGKNSYDDKAPAWISLFTYEGYPNMITYNVFDYDKFKGIQNALSASGFKLSGSEIEDDELVTSYSNQGYILKINTAKQNDNDWSSRSYTSYVATIIKKAGIYDPNNGLKQEYYDNNQLQGEYTLKDGELHGALKTYHKNGKLHVVGNFNNGKKNGVFKTFDEYGDLVEEYSYLNGELSGPFKEYHYNGKLAKSGNHKNGEEDGWIREYNLSGILVDEYFLKDGAINGNNKEYYDNGVLKKDLNFLNGELHGICKEYDENGTLVSEYYAEFGKYHGVVKVFEDGKISIESEYGMGMLNGRRVEYYYDEDTGILRMKAVISYRNDKKHGREELIVIEDGKEVLWQFFTYLNDIKGGPFREVDGSVIIEGEHNNGQLHGIYTKYQDVNSMVLGGFAHKGNNLVYKRETGFYSNGKKTGFWKYFDITESVTAEGYYKDDLEHGEWKYYYEKIVDTDSGEETKLAPYAQKLYSIQQYKEGKLDGKVITFSYLQKEVVDCDTEKYPHLSSSDTCYKTIFIPVYSEMHFKNGSKNGPFLLKDSTGSLLAEGAYVNDKEHGFWRERNVTNYTTDEGETDFFITYLSGKYEYGRKEGLWQEYNTDSLRIKSMNYRNDRLHGTTVKWRSDTPIATYEYDNGNYFKVVDHEENQMVEVLESKWGSHKILVTMGVDKEQFIIGMRLDTELPSDPEWLLPLIDAITNLSQVEGVQVDNKILVKDGIFKAFNSAKQLIIDGQFSNDLQDGEWSLYHYEQDVVNKKRFDKGSFITEQYLTLSGLPFSGTFIVYSDQGTVNAKIQIKNGLRNGKTLVYGEDGKTITSKETFKNGIRE